MDVLCYTVVVVREGLWVGGKKNHRKERGEGGSRGGLSVSVMTVCSIEEKWFRIGSSDV